MKRTLEQSFGSSQASRELMPRLLQQNAGDQPVAKPPGVAPGRPVLRSLQHSDIVNSIWPQPDSSGAMIVPQQSVNTVPSVATVVATHDIITAKAKELRAAILEDNVGVVQAILSHPDASDIAAFPDAQGKNALFHAVEKNDWLTMDCLMRLPSGPVLALQRSHQGLIPLHVAVANESVVGVMQLLALSSAQEQIAASLLQIQMLPIPHPLMEAVGRGGEGVVRTLLASPHAAPLVESKDVLGSNALLIAATNGSEGVVRAILESNYADTLAQDSNHLGFNALMVAVVNGHDNVVRAMLGSAHATALVQGRNQQGCNALMLAAMCGHERIVKALLEQGMLSQPLHSGGAPVTALDFALAKGHLRIANLLRRHGAVRAMKGTSSSSIMPQLPRQ